MEVQRQPWRLGPRGVRWFDRLLAGGLLLPVLVLPAGYPWPEVLLSAAQLLPLFWRRRYPLQVFAAVTVLHAGQVLAMDVPAYGQLGFPVALYSVARFTSGRWGLVALAVGLVGVVLATFDWTGMYTDSSASALVSIASSIAAAVIAAWALGTLGRTRQAYVDTLLQRNEQIRRETSQQVELAAADERARIAREMHDVVAHGLSVIVVQADGARYAAATSPAAATDALGTIAATAREALGEMRRMLGLLRADDTAAVRPQPGLGDLPDLLADVDDVELPEDGAAVPDGVALAAYRVVQEALSNVRKHAGPGARVRVRVTADTAARELTAEVTDDGRGAAATDDGRGLGLRGMRERVDAHGGTLEAGPLPGGGFRVWARMPW